MTRRTFYRLLTAGSLLMLSASAFSLPAQGAWQDALTTGGQTIKVRLAGDEHFSYFEDATGNYYRQEHDGRLSSLTTWQVETQRQRAFEQVQNKPRRAPRRAAQSQYKGQRRAMLVLVDFDDVPFQAGHDNAFYQRVMNEVGLDMGRYRHSVHDYFLEQSYGQFDLTFDVYGPYRLSQLSSWYGENVSYGIADREERHGLVAMHAAQAAIREIDDLSIYDWDGDKQVDQLCVLYAGLGQSSGGTANDIWAHESSLTDIQSMYGSSNGRPVTHNGYTIDVYSICNELNRRATYNSQGQASYTNEIIDAGIGPFCHEFSHCLGLPDFYATSGTVLGQFELLDKGWQLDDSFQPAGYSAYERWFCGWLEPVELRRSHTYTSMKPLEQSGEAYVLYCDNASRNEYYLFENRQQTGCDQAFPSAGLYVTRIDYSASLWQQNLPNESASGYHQRYVYIGANVFNPNDVSKVCFPQGTVNAISDTGIPRFQQYNGSNTLTSFMGHAVENITQNADGTISFSYVNKNESAPTFTYERQVTAGNYGTLVLEYPVERIDLEGVEQLYNIAGVVLDADSKPATLVLEEEEGDLVAGRPYIFCAKGSTLMATSWSTVPVTKASNYNGLTGVFATFTVTAAHVRFFPDTYYMLSAGRVVQAGLDSSVEANRAYINMKQVPVLTPSEASAVKGLTLNFGSDADGVASTPQLTSDNQSIFDLSGRRVSQAGSKLPSSLPRGLYIVGGKKVAVK